MSKLEIESQKGRVLYAVILMGIFPYLVGKIIGLNIEAVFYLLALPSVIFWGSSKIEAVVKKIYILLTKKQCA